MISNEGEFVDNHEKMCEMTKEYFKDIFTAFDEISTLVPNTEQGIVSTAQNRMLTSELTFEEFSIAIKQMHPDKASGRDGFSPAFFQHFWDIVGREVFNCCKGWLEDFAFPAEVNSTNLILIPKKDNVKKLSDV